MPKERIQDEEVKLLSKKVMKVTRLAGGLTKITSGAKVSHQVIYRLQGGARIEVESAEKIKAFLVEEGLLTEEGD